jgi:hypothetical protein
VTRPAHAILLLEGGMSCQKVADVLFFDDDPIRGGCGCSSNAVSKSRRVSMLAAVSAS